MGKTCNKVNLGIPNDRNEHKWQAYGKQIDRWSASADSSTQRILGSMSRDAGAFGRTAGARRHASWTHFWDGFGRLQEICTGNGTPMNP